VAGQNFSCAPDKKCAGGRKGDGGFGVAFATILAIVRLAMVGPYSLARLNGGYPPAERRLGPPPGSHRKSDLPSQRCYLRARVSPSEFARQKTFLCGVADASRDKANINRNSRSSKASTGVLYRLPEPE
jgi:hypothetical protein